MHDFSCHCTYIAADEFKLTTDLTSCQDAEMLNAVMQVKFPINLPFLTEYFTPEDLASIFVDTLSNDTLDVRVPNLALQHGAELDELFAQQEQGSWEMVKLINRTKQDAKSFDSLSHYLWNEIMKANDNQNEFNFFSPFSWLTIFGWIFSLLALVLAIMLRFKVRTISMMLMVRTAKASVLPKALHVSTSVPPPTTDPLNLWISHVQHVPNLMPIEVLILLVLILIILFFLARWIYRTRNQNRIRCILRMQIGNLTDSISLPLANLVNSPSVYRFMVSREAVNFRMVNKFFGAQLFLGPGFCVHNIPLEYNEPIPDKIFLMMGQVKRVRHILNGPHYAAVEVIDARKHALIQLAVLRNYQDWQMTYWGSHSGRHISPRTQTHSTVNETAT